jgi:hypothetical protein
MTEILRRKIKGLFRHVYPYFATKWYLPESSGG